MKPKEYIKNALRTESTKSKGRKKRIQHALMGLTTETGEFTDNFKKHIFYSQKLDEVNMIEEIGDLMWYLAILCDELGISFEEVWDKNIRKLKARFPDKYSHKKVAKRNLQKERKELTK